jgi:hypothetical protein
VARGTSAELLEWKTIEVHELSKRPNSKIIVLGDKSGAPILERETAPIRWPPVGGREPSG